MFECAEINRAVGSTLEQIEFYKCQSLRTCTISLAATRATEPLLTHRMTQNCLVALTEHMRDSQSSTEGVGLYT